MPELSFIKAVAWIFRNLQGFDLRAAKAAVENAQRNIGQEVPVTGTVRLRAYRQPVTGWEVYQLRRI